MLKPPIPVSMTALPGAANFITVTPSIVILFDRLALRSCHCVTVLPGSSKDLVETRRPLARAAALQCSRMKTPATDCSARVLRTFRRCHSASVLPDVSKLDIAALRRGCACTRKRVWGELKTTNDFNAPATVHGVVFSVFVLSLP